MTLKTIRDIDFAALYRTHAKLSIRQPKTADDWDARADRMRSGQSCTGESYIKQFLSKMDFEGCASLLDVGCGGGTIGLAAASKLEKVYELDYSPKMLKVVQERALELGVTNYETILKSWSDDWDNVPQCDICVSSRSSMVEDLEDALAKLNQKAKKAVYMTMTVEKDFIQQSILKALGRADLGFPTYIYAVNMLYQQGYEVTVDFIRADHTASKQVITDLGGFIQAVKWSIGELTATEIERLTDYYQRHQSTIKAVYQGIRPWAFLSWKTH